MKKLNKALAVLLLAANVAFAEPVSVDFKAATVVDVVQTLVKEVLHRDFVIAPDVLQSQQRITVNVRGVAEDRILPMLEGVLKTVNVQIVERDGILYVEKSTPVTETGQGMYTNKQPGQTQDKMTSAEVPVQPVALPVSKQENELPSDYEIEIYWPQHRGVDILAQAVKLSGAKMLEQQDKAGALVFAGKPATNKRALDLLAKFDRATAAVDVKAVVIEYTDSTEKTNSFQAVVNLFNERLGIKLDAGSAAGNAIAISSGTLKLLLTALEGDSRFKYVAEPAIRVLDGEKGKITVGQEVPTRGQVTMDANGNSLQSIVYKTAGVMLELAPKVYEDSIVMAVTQQISTFTTTTTSGIDSPTVMKRDLSTTIDAKSGDVILLAGMDETRESSSHSGFSFLPKIMHGSGSNNSRSQILLLLEVNRSHNGAMKANYAPVEDKSCPFVES